MATNLHDRPTAQEVLDKLGAFVRRTPPERLHAKFKPSLSGYLAFLCVYIASYYACPCHCLFNVMYLSCLLSVAFAYCLREMLIEFLPILLEASLWGVIWARHVFSYLRPVIFCKTDSPEIALTSLVSGTMAYGNAHKVHTSHVQPIDAPMESSACTRSTLERILHES